MRYNQHISSLSLADRLELNQINEDQRSINHQGRLIADNIGGWSLRERSDLIALQIATNNKRSIFKAKNPELSKIYYVCGGK
jgi:hypothetical protein